MAYTTQTLGAVNESMAYSDLLPILVAKSNFLQYQLGVSGQKALGEELTWASPVMNALVDYTGADLAAVYGASTKAGITLSAAKSWSETVNNIDLSKQTMGDYLAKFTDAKLAQASLAIDAAIATAAATTTTAGTTVAITDALVEAFMEDGITKLTNEGVSESSITAYVPSYIYWALMRVQGRATQATESAIQAGIVLPYGQARVVQSSSLVAGVGVGSKLAIFAADYGVQYAIGHMESSIVDAGARNFGYASKGLVNYGAGLLDAKSVCKIEVTKA
jgi:hypothetical protein